MMDSPLIFALIMSAANGGGSGLRNFTILCRDCHQLRGVDYWPHLKPLHLKSLYPYSPSDLGEIPTQSQAA
jgi:hypothetical protein